MKHKKVFTLLAFAIVLIGLQMSAFAQTLTGDPVWLYGGTQSNQSAPGEIATRYFANTWKDNANSLFLYGGWTRESLFGGTLASMHSWNDQNALFEILPVNVGLSGISYGEQGVPSPSNSPGQLQPFSTARDAQGNLWMFSTQALWKFDVESLMWTWVSGTNSPTNPNGVYATKGVESEDALPSSRSGSGVAVDYNGNIWVFGGTGFDSKGEQGALNDLWRYNPVSGKWAWMKGSNTIDPVPVYGTKGQSSVNVTPGGRSDGNFFTDNSGRLILMMGRGIVTSKFDNGDFTNVFAYNPENNQWAWLGGPPSKNPVGVAGEAGQESPLFTPKGRYGNAFLGVNGNNEVFIYGGTENAKYYSDLWKFNLTTGNWAWMAGSLESDSEAIFGTKGIPDASNWPGKRYGASGWIDKDGGLYFFGGEIGFNTGTPGTIEAGSQYMNDMWRLGTTSAPVTPLWLEQYEPAFADRNTEIVVKGSGFGKSQENSQVLLNEVPMTVSSWDTTEIRFAVPNDFSYGDYAVSVQIGGTRRTFTSPLAVADQSQPTVLAISSRRGTVGQVIELEGYGFGATAGEIRFEQSASTVAQASIQEWTANAVTFTVPTVSAGDYTISLVTSNSLSSNVQGTFTVLEAGIFLDVDPVTLYGSTAAQHFTGAYDVLSYTVSAAGLSSDLVITPPNGFLVRLSTGIFFGSSLSITQVSGIIDPVTVEIRLFPGYPTPGPLSGIVTHTGGGQPGASFPISGVIYPANSIQSTVTSFETFVATLNQPSPAQSYLLNGFGLSSNLIVEASSGFEISQFSADAGFAGTLSLAPIYDRVKNVTIWIRAKASAQNGPLSGTITHRSTNIPSMVLDVAAEIGERTPEISVINGNLATFSTQVGQPSSAQSYTVSAQHLTGALTITPPENVEVSIANGTSGYTSSLVLQPNEGTINATTVWVRISATASAGAISGSIVHASQGAVARNVGVIGTVTTPTLTAPTLTYPPNQASNVTRSPIFAWSLVEGASEYTVQWSQMSSFQTLLGSTTLSQSTLTISNLPNSAVIFWRVRARANGVDGPWAVSEFSTVRVLEGRDNLTIIFNWGNSTSNPEAYKIFSFIGLDPITPLSLGLDQGNAGSWRAFTHLGGDRPIETRQGASAPGQGMWLMSKQEINAAIEVRNVTLDDNDEYGIPIAFGWNIIGLPFRPSNQNQVDWIQVQELNNTPSTLWEFEVGRWVSKSQMVSNVGYYFYNEVPTRSRLFIPFAEYPRVTPSKISTLPKELITFIISDESNLSSEVVVTNSLLHGLQKQHKPLPQFSNLDIRIENLHTIDKSDENAILASGQLSMINRTSFKTSKISALVGEDNVALWIVNPITGKIHRVDSDDSFSLEIPCTLTSLSWFVTSKAVNQYQFEELHYQPINVKLFQNYPNPFNPSTTITFQLDQTSHVKLAVHDLTGRTVQQLTNSTLSAGLHSFSFDASHLSSGLYFYTLSTSEGVWTKKMHLLK